ncbi:MAG: PAS domain S-box protein [Candidatus Hodarchaeota archaeon]
MTIESLLTREDIPEDAKNVIRAEINSYERKMKNSLLSLIQSEARLEVALETADLGIWEHNIETGEVFQSERVSQIYGYSLSEIPSTIEWWQSLIHPEDKPKVLEKLDQLIQGHLEFFKAEYRFLHKSGEWKWILSRGKAVERDQDGRALRLTGTLLDTTIQRSTARALHESEAKFRLLFEGAPIPSMEFDLSLTLEYLDQLQIQEPQELEELLAQKPEEITKLGETIQVLNANEAALKFFQIHIKEEWALGKIGDPYVGHPFFKQILKVLLEGGVSYEDEIIAHTVKEKREIRALCKATFLHDSDQRLTRGIVSLIDITTSKRIEQALRESEVKYRTLVEQAQDGIVIVQGRELNGKMIFFNQRFAQMLGYHSEELSDTIFTHIIHPEVMESLLSRLSKREFIIDSTLVTKNGNPIEIELNLGQIQYRNEQAILAIVRDITERKKTEKLRRELEDRRDNFVWMTSHELRTPLTVIRGYIDLLLMNLGEIKANKQEKILKTILSNIQRLERLTDQVSLIAQFQYGTFKIQKQRFNFCTFFNEAMEPYKIMLGDQFEFDSCKWMPPLMIEGDKNRLAQVIENLLGNAIRHTHQDHRLIEVHFEVQSLEIRIDISDNGAGIDHENLDRIFEQFVSIETEYSATGTGIGLYLSQRILKAHGGAIKVHSEGIGKGSCFTIELPRTWKGDV